MASRVSATAMIRAIRGICGPVNPYGYPRPSMCSWCNSMPGSMSLSCETGRMMLAPLVVCVFMISNSSGVSEPGFFNTRSSTPIFPTSCSNAAMRSLSRSSAVSLISCAMIVECGRQHANRADKQLAIFFRGLLQPLDVLFDVAGHQVEVFGQFADFGGAAHGSALVKFAAADGARGSGQRTNRRADAHGKEITKENRHQYHHADERQCLAVQFGHARVGARFIQTPLG